MKELKLSRIVSGGQTGADVAGLEAAIQLGLQTGGRVPKDFRTEKGPMPVLGERYGLIETESRDYRDRTGSNIIASDGTVIFGDIDSAGSKFTFGYCTSYSKPVICNPTKEQFLKFLRDKEIVVLNVAGNRESKNPGIYERTFKFLMDALKV